MDDCGPVYLKMNIMLLKDNVHTIVDISAFCRDSIEFNRLYIAISLDIISLKDFHSKRDKDGNEILPEWSDDRHGIVPCVSQILNEYSWIDFQIIQCIRTHSNATCAPLP